MSITLITAVPGGGKTLYAVWHLIKPAVEEGKTIYTVAIPELKLPTIRLGYKDIRKWHEREKIEVKNDFDLELIDDEIPTRLLNFQEGSMIVIDEVQMLWPSSGSRDPGEDITYLTKHRHHGLEIVLITQSPQLVHAKVLAVVDKHIHIRKTWAGRQLMEWPEYCSTPRAYSSRMMAIKRSYKLPTQAFGLYRSATVHVKQRMSKPVLLYLFPIILLVTAYFAITSVQSVIARTQDQEKPTKEVRENKNDVYQPSAITGANNDSRISTQTEQQEELSFVVQAPALVSDRVDWTKVSSCLSTKDRCICYGHSAERLVIPPQTCRLAVEHGWPGTRIIQASVSHQ